MATTKPILDAETRRHPTNAGIPRGPHFDSTRRKFLHGNLIAGLNAQMLQPVLTQGHLPFGGDGERVHRGASR